MDDSFIGQIFGLIESQMQAEFFNHAGRTLRRASHQTSVALGFDMQCCRIVDKLDDDGKHLIKTLAAFIACDEDPRRKISHA